VTQNFPCDRTDASGHLFVDVFQQKVVASATFGGHGPGCVASPRPARGLRRRPLPRVATCPPRDLRNLAYSVLGPDAVSVTYTIAGRQRTVPIGPDGAYIVVLPPNGTDLHCRGPARWQPLPRELRRDDRGPARIRRDHGRALSRRPRVPAPCAQRRREPASLVPERRLHRD